MFGASDVKNAVIQIDGVNWYSMIPQNSGEAQTLNNDACTIVAKLTAK